MMEVGDNQPLTNQTGIFHISVGDVGGLHGAAFSVTADKNFTYPHFFVGQGSVEPQRTSGAQIWLGMSILSRISGIRMTDCTPQPARSPFLASNTPA